LTNLTADSRLLTSSQEHLVTDTRGFEKLETGIQYADVWRQATLLPATPDVSKTHISQVTAFR